MSKKNNDSIENFFRKAVSQQDTSSLENDWKKMEQRLDRHKADRAVTRTRNLTRAALAVVVLSVISIGSYFLGSRNNIGQEGSRNVLSTETQAAATSKALENSKIVNSAADLVSSPESGTPEENDGSRNRVNDKNEKGVRIKAESRDESDAIPSIKENATTSLTTKTNIDNESKFIRQNNADTNPTSKSADLLGNETNKYLSLAEKDVAEKEESTLADDLTSENQNRQETSSKDAPEAEAIIQEEKVEAPVTTANPDSKDDEQKDLPAKIPSRWNVAIMLAPDFSTAGLKNYTTPGKSYGILIGYNVLKRLSISTGLFRSSKIYEGYGDQYQPPEGYWQRRTNGIIPDEINGTCEVFEIPVLLQYTVIQKMKSRAYVTAGFASYQITSEKYKYSFTDPNPGAASSWSTDNATTYPFNIGQISIGYERQLAPRIAFGIEPFLKVPFRGMGWSNVNIFSTGAFFNLRYRFFKSEK